MLDCTNLLVPRLDAPTAIVIPYIDGGPSLSNTYLDFYIETPITDCLFTCNFGDSCGPSTLITEPNVW